MIFVVILALVAVVNIFSSHLLALINNISVWWHVVGAAVVDPGADLRPRPRTRASTTSSPTRINNSGCSTGRRAAYWFLRPPAGLPAHPVHDHRVRRLGAPVGGDPGGGGRRGQGHLAVDLLLRRRRLHPAARVRVRRRRTTGRPTTRASAAASAYIFGQALGPTWHGLVLFISAAGQLFCTDGLPDQRRPG